MKAFRPRRRANAILTDCTLKSAPLWTFVTLIWHLWPCRISTKELHSSQKIFCAFCKIMVAILLILIIVNFNCPLASGVYLYGVVLRYQPSTPSWNKQRDFNQSYAADFDPCIGRGKFAIMLSVPYTTIQMDSEYLDLWWICCTASSTCSTLLKISNLRTQSGHKLVCLSNIVTSGGRQLQNSRLVMTMQMYKALMKRTCLAPV